MAVMYDDYTTKLAAAYYVLDWISVVSNLSHSSLDMFVLRALT